MAQKFKVMKRVAATCSELPDQVFAELIEELGFPALVDGYEDFDGAGASGPTIEISTGQMEKLTMTLKMLGNHSDLYAVFRKKAVWTFTGVVEDEVTGEKVPHEVTATCRLGGVTPEAKNRTGLHKHDYELKSIMAAEISENGKELFGWAWGESPRFAGVKIEAEDDAILGLA